MEIWDQAGWQVAHLPSAGVLYLWVPDSVRGRWPLRPGSRTVENSVTSARLATRSYRTGSSRQSCRGHVMCVWRESSCSVCDWLYIYEIMVDTLQSKCRITTGMSVFVLFTVVFFSFFWKCQCWNVSGKTLLKSRISKGRVCLFWMLAVFKLIAMFPEMRISL